MLCLRAAQLKFWFSNWPRMRKFSQLLKAGKTWLCSPWSRVGLALRPIFRLWLVKIWQLSSCGKFMHCLEHLETCFTLTAEADRVLVSTRDIFNCLFPLDVRNEIQLLSGVFRYSRLVCSLGFWLRNTSLVKVRNPISDSIVFVFHLAWCVRGMKSLKRYWPYLIPFRSCIFNAWVIIVFDVCFFISNLMKSGVVYAAI